MGRDAAILQLRQLLVRRRDAIRSALLGDLTELRELAAASGDLADFALDSSCEEITAQMAEVESRELGNIEEALSRFGEGNYGNCRGCQKPIPLARLKALPFAALCIDCQIKLEKSGYEDWSEMVADVYDAEEAMGDGSLR